MKRQKYSVDQLIDALMGFEPDFLLVSNIPVRELASALGVTRELRDALQNLLDVHEGRGGTRYHAGEIAREAIKKANEIAP